MKKFFILLFTGLTLSMAGCNKESYIEGSDAPGNPGNVPVNTNLGRVSFYCTNIKMDNCGSLTVSVDGSTKGTLRYRATSTPGCGVNADRVLSIELTPGSHAVSVTSSSSSCMRYTLTVNITKGGCLMQQLN